MKRLFSILSLAILFIFSACTGDDGPPGPVGPPGPDSEVFELRNVNFTLNNNQYSISRPLDPQILGSDNILIYRLSGTINSTTPIWQLIPKTLFLSDMRELDYTYDFSRIDFTIIAAGNYNIATTPEYINNQTFRIVIIPGYFSKLSTGLNMNDYNAVIKKYGIDDKNVTVLN